MIKKIAVLGAGTMGHGIAEIFAMYKYDVNLYDPFEQTLKNVKKIIGEELEFLAKNNYIEENEVKETLSRITLFSNFEEAVKDVDFAIEATLEKIELKQELFESLDKICKKDTILASNTSSLQLSDMISKVSEERKKYCMLNHWYNPAHLMPLVELSYFGNMPDEIFVEVEKLYKNINKVTIKILKEIPGLVANRIQQGVAREVFSLIENNIASSEDIDKALMFGPAFRYATTGQLEVADLGGIDIWCIVGDNLLKEMDNSQNANNLLREKIKENKLGIKTGEGFFKYNEEDKLKVKNDFFKRLLTQLKVSEEYKK
ncbi:MAG: 3-hydroxyacyl-CoA dehydrogenase family protein [Fusobacterium sp.]|nr:3-hydroxyacyl-CoA dehydrogenase family protein [Fusobacterium sp.]